MPLPPAWLVEWTRYIALLATTIAAVRALLKGGTLLSLKINALRGGSKNA